MEFRYRAGEEKPLPYKSQGGDGYFTSQPLRATYVTGDDLRRRDSLLQSYLPCPSPTDALRRVLEKERIREEIIAREILLRRELEEEVRRELAVQREFALRRQAEGFAFASSSSLIPTSWPPLAPVDSRISERSFIASRRSIEGGCFGRLSAELQPDPTVTVIKSIDEIEKVKSMTSLVAGTKMEPTSGNELAWLSNMNSKVPKEWSCALCQVSATSKESLDKHLQGKRHRAKEAQLKGSKKGGQPTTECPTVTEKNVEIPRSSGKDDGPLPKQPKNQVQKKQKTVKSNDGKKPRKRQKTESAEKGPVIFVCELCNVKCCREVVLQCHYRGKKHKARVNCRNGAKAASSEGPRKKEDDDLRREEDNDIHRKEDEGRHGKEDESLHRKEDEDLPRKEDEGLDRKEDEGLDRKEDEGLDRKEDESLHRKEDEGLDRKEDEGLHRKAEEGLP